MKKNLQDYEREMAFQACVLGVFAVLIGFGFFLITFIMYIAGQLKVSIFVYLLVCVIIPIGVISAGVMLFLKGRKISATLPKE